MPAVLQVAVDPATTALVVASVALLVIAGSTAVLAAVQYRRHLAGVPEYVRRERLAAYSAVMSRMIALNRLAVELDEDDRFTVEKHKYAMSKESAIETPAADLTETFQRHYHVVDPAVREAVDDYLDFLARYDADPDRRPVGTLLDRSRRVVTAMRADLGLSSFGPTVPDSQDATPGTRHGRATDHETSD
ncbi:hypothetical protein [Salinirubrum litoreum]|uniref:DUF4129 domain-containing protein n=1 Tax=Salinirubrum litoreum TaxID=1126234 RepID=A0ABD5RGU3_9EURY|nr:hypothetical protein [Salinirubrum litoreum]